MKNEETPLYASLACSAAFSRHSLWADLGDKGTG